MAAYNLANIRLDTKALSTDALKVQLLLSNHVFLMLPQRWAGYARQRHDGESTTSCSW